MITFDRTALALIVAPRVNAEQPISDQQRERNQRAQEADRRAFERSQRRRLEDIQRPERETRQASADPAVINHRQAEEKQALDTPLQRSRQQHEARQEVAQMATERGRTSSAKSKTQEGKSKGTDKSKGKGKKADSKKDR